MCRLTLFTCLLVMFVRAYPFISLGCRLLPFEYKQLQAARTEAGVVYVYKASKTENPISIDFRPY